MSDDPWQGWQAFGAAAQSYIEALKAGSPAGAAAQFGDFLRDQFAQFVPWQTPARPHQEPPQDIFGMSAFASAGAGGWAGTGAAIGPAREHQERAQRLAQAWRRMEAAQRRLQRLWQDVLREASSSFMAQVGANATAFSTPDGLRAQYDRWIDCAEQAYARTAHSEAFCQAQAELVNAGSEWRHEQQGNVEQWMKQLDLPTRSEINSLTRRLQDVESQLRAQQPPTVRRRSRKKT